MPYVKVGNCIHKQNSDGSAGEQLHCYDGEGASEKADKYMRALYANVKSSEVQELSMSIVKASLDKSTQEMRWRAVASDTDKDLYAESMSLELFSDFVRRINEEVSIPAPFDSVICENDWCGGTPYLSISHYKSGTAKKNVPGEIKSIYVDGNRLKGTGTLDNTPMGKKVFDEMCKDLYAKRSQQTDYQPIRISIGFLDLEHKHIGNSSEFTFTRKDLNQICPLCSQGIGDKIYTKGQLVHWALTRVPVNTRTLMEVDKSMPIRTRKDDAKSIIGEMAEELEEEALTTRSEAANEIIVVKADEVNQVDEAKKIGSEPLPKADKWAECYDGNFGNYNQECIDNLVNSTLPDFRKEVVKEIDTIGGYSAVKSESEMWQLPIRYVDGKIDTKFLSAVTNSLKRLEIDESVLEEIDMTQVNRGNTSEAKKLLKVPVDIKDRFDDEDVLEEETDENPSKVSAEGKVPTNPKGKTAIKANSKPAAKDDYDEAEDENDPGDKKDTKADEAFDKMKKKMRQLRSQGITGPEALKMVQDDFNKLGQAIEVDLSGASNADNAQIMQQLSILMNEVSAARRENAELKAIVSGNSSVDRSSIPASRAISLKSNSMKPEDLMLKSVPFQKTSENEGTTSQIKALARKSTGLK